MAHIPAPSPRSLTPLLLAALVFPGTLWSQKIIHHTAQEPLVPEEAARTMVVPEGFQVTLFAGEPDVLQPIAFCIDSRGRLWVAEAHQYPVHGTEPGMDRIVILEDSTGDGRHDRRTVFYEGLNYVSGIEVGFGGVWVTSPPFFYFIPDRDRDDRPDSEPVLLLDGFGNHANAHNMANHLAWGPDGWLYGTHGRTNWSLPGKPGTPEAERTRFDGGVWRYHPVRHVWESFSDGTTNPFGIDWNDYGHAFTCNSVDPHIFHAIQGAHYEPWRNRDSSRHAYQRIATIADHLHFTGSQNVRDGLGSEAEDLSGGGHAHAGTMIYLGDNWPAAYRNRVFMNNIHGRRINQDILARSGSGYTASHAPDLMRSRDPWYMGTVLRYGPDGSVFAADWSDTDECHSRRNTRRETGRIYRISYGTPARDRTDLVGLTDDQLVERQLHRNDFHVRQARRILQERAAAGRDMTAVHAALHRIFRDNPDVTRKLRALWALHVTGGLDPAFLITQLGHGSEHVRAWSVQLLCEDRNSAPDAAEALVRLAQSDASALVRLYLASALQRLAPDDRWAVAAALLARAEDASDQNLPLMAWYGIQPLAQIDISRFAQLAAGAKLSLVRRHGARRATETDLRTAGLPAVLQQLGKTSDEAIRLDLITGILDGLEGSRSVAMPEGWMPLSESLRASSDPAVRARSVELALIFDDPGALAALMAQAGDPTLPAAGRARALEALLARRPPALASVLLELTADPDTRRTAVRGLAEYDHPETPDVLLAAYAGWNAAARQDALQTLASRPAWAGRLLDAIESGKVPRADLTAYTARHIGQLGDPLLAARIGSLWGEVRPASADKTGQIAKWLEALTPEVLAAADLSAGRAVYQRLCAACHRLFDDGGGIGPELTGSQRDNLDYLLENIIDPSGAVTRDYQLHTIETADGRILTGFIRSETATSVTLQSLNEQIVVPAAEIRQRRSSAQSMMPEGLLQILEAGEVRDLIAYLTSPQQVPLPAEK